MVAKTITFAAGVVTLLLSGLYHTDLWAFGKRGIKVTPDEEVRSVIREVDGYAFLSEDMTIRDVRRVAFETAKRQALESAEVMIQSKTKVDKGVLTYDVIESDAGGYVSILSQKDFGIEDGSRYHVWIKAEVKYGLKDTQADNTLLASSSAPLTVRLWTDKKVFKEGEKIVVFLEGNRDFYARVVDIMADGSVIQLLPNQFRRENFFRSGIVYQIPNHRRGDKFNLEVTPPFGTDKIVVYASDVPLGNVDLDGIGGGLGVYQGSQKMLSSATRGIKVSWKKNSSIHGAKPQEAAPSVEFYEAAWRFKTTRR